MEFIALKMVRCRLTDEDGKEFGKEFGFGEVLEGVPEDQLESLVRVGWAISRPDFEALDSEPEAVEDEGEPEGSEEDAAPADPGEADSDEDAAADSMPEGARERIEWIGKDADRALEALEDEDGRGEEARKTVVEHAEDVLEAASE